MCCEGEKRCCERSQESLSPPLQTSCSMKESTGATAAHSRSIPSSTQAHRSIARLVGILSSREDLDFARRHFLSKVFQLADRRFIEAMNDFASTLYQARYVHTLANHAAFIEWCSETADEEQLDAAFRVCYELLHEVPHPELDANCFKEPLVIRRPDLGRQWTMTRMWCTEPYCDRCTLQQGGWSFRWIGPWTCPTLIGDEHSTTPEIERRASACNCGRHRQPWCQN